MIDLRRRLEVLREQKRQSSHRDEPDRRADPPREVIAARGEDAVTAYDDLWFEGRPLDA